MKNSTQFSTTPVKFNRTERSDDYGIVSSLDAGKIVPVTYIPLLREDALVSGKCEIALEMNEVNQIIANPVEARLEAWFIPFLAFDRFNGSLHDFDKSYMGEKIRDTDASAIPFIEEFTSSASHGGDEIYKALGLHTGTSAAHNGAVAEAYNALVNFKRRNRSKSLPLRDYNDTTLARAFWNHKLGQNIVPDFDQDRIEGQVALTIDAANLPVKGIGGFGDKSLFPNNGTNVLWANDEVIGNNDAEGRASLMLKVSNGVADVYAELAGQTASASVADFRNAEKTAAFARLKEQMQGYGVSDEWIVDMLMQGLTVADETLRHPVFMADDKATFKFQRRYATNASELDQSVSSGFARLSVPLRLPRMSTGGIVLVTVQITPQQIFERKKDYFLHASTPNDFPNALHDELDLEKVSIVTNDHVDIDHTAATGLFGYAPLNHEWRRSGVRVGGKYFRPVVNLAVDTDRQKFWAVETVDPELTEDFYLCTNLHKKVFADPAEDGFELVGAHRARISGLTVFGPQLTEATNTYAEVAAISEGTRIVK